MSRARDKNRILKTLFLAGLVVWAGRLMVVEMGQNLTNQLAAKATSDQNVSQLFEERLAKTNDLIELLRFGQRLMGREEWGLARMAFGRASEVAPDNRDAQLYLASTSLRVLKDQVASGSQVDNEALLNEAKTALIAARELDPINPMLMELETAVRDID